MKLSLSLSPSRRKTRAANTVSYELIPKNYWHQHFIAIAIKPSHENEKKREEVITYFLTFAEALQVNNKH